jgi:AbrB family looped-hinge helix DNA binding protein
MSDEMCQSRAAHVKLGEGGRIVIPADFRTALGARVGDKLVLHLEGRELTIYTLDEAIKRAQAMVRRYVPEGHSLADELIAERRAEAAREDEAARENEVIRKASTVRE